MWHGGEKRRDKTFQKQSLIPARTRSILQHYHPLFAWLSSRNLVGQGRAHIAMWLHWKLLNIERLQSLCSWAAIPTYVCTPLTDLTNPPRWFINLVVFHHTKNKFSNTHTSIVRSLPRIYSARLSILHLRCFF
jgi:hypothetical protein